MEDQRECCQRTLNPVDVLLDKLYLSLYFPILWDDLLQDILSFFNARAINIKLCDREGKTVKKNLGQYLSNGRHANNEASGCFEINAFSEVRYQDTHFCSESVEDKNDADGIGSLVLSVTRDKTKGQFSEPESEACNDLCTNLGRRFVLSNLMEAGVFVQGCVFGALCKTGQVAFLVDSNMKVLATNPILNNSFYDVYGSVRIDNRTLVVNNSEIEKRLRQSVNAVINKGFCDEPVFLVGSKDPVQLRVVKSDDKARDSALVIIRKKHVNHSIYEDALKDLWILSNREVELVSAFFENPNIKDLCYSLNISYETARWHLKRIMTKMNVKSQAELVKKLYEYCILEKWLQ